MALQLNQELQNKYPHLDIHITNLQNVDKEYLIFGSDFNGKSRELSLLSIKSDKKVSDYFEFISKTYKETNEEVYIYDLTHSLGNFLQETELNNDLGSGKKLAVSGDFVISRLRSYLQEIAVVQPKKHKQFFSTEYLIYRPKTDEISANTLLAFSLSKPVQNILNKSQYGTEHPRFYEFVFNEMPIPNSIFALNNEIDEIMKNAYECLEQSKALYREAEVLLYRELGLDPENPLASIETLSGSLNISVRPLSQSLNATGRLDSEYYQDKYDLMEKQIKKNGFKTLEEICSLINYGSVPTSPYSENGEGVPYIKGLNLKNLQIDETKLDRITNTEDLNSRFFTKENDIVISQMGTVGDVGVVSKEQENYIFASFTIRVRLKNIEEFNPYFVALYIQNIAKEWYLYRNIAQASVRQNTDLPTIKNLYVPLISYEKQTQIAEKIKQSFTLRKKASELLQTAKQSVETAIEKG